MEIFESILPAQDLNERKLTWYDNQERWSMGYAPTVSIRALRIKSVGTDVFVLDETGNVGLGVSTPERKLDVNGSMRLATSTQPANLVSGDIYNDGSNLFYYDGLTWVELTSGGTSSFWNQNGSAIYYSGGNVGIGTSSPSAMLAVGPNNEFQVAGNGTTTINGTVILPLLSTGGILKVNGGTATVDIATAGTDYEVPLSFANGLSRNTNTVTLGGTLTQNTELNLNSNALYFTTGNVGFGISTPSRIVDINGVMGLRTTTEPASGLIGDIYSDGTAVYFYDGTGWQDLLGGGGSDLFTDGGATTYMTSLSDNFALAGNNSNAPFFFDSTNQILTLTNSTTGASFLVNDQGADTTPFIVDAAGSVGIGTATPARPLTVNGAMRLITTTQPTGGAAGDIYSDGTSLYFHNGTAFQNLSTGASLWQQNGANIYFNTGLVGVGTNNPLSAFHVEASANPQLRIVDTSTSTAGLMANASGLYTVTNTGALIFRTGVSAGGDWATSGSEQMRINATGVGIGNTNPQRALHVGGPIRLDTAAEPLTAAAGDIYSSGTSLYFYDGTGWQDLLNGGGASIWTDGGTTSYLTQTTDNLALGGSDSTAPFFFNAAAQLLALTNTTTGVSFRVNDQLSDPSPFVIDSSGLVGIGTASPGTELDVNGTLTQRGVSAPSVSAASTGRIYFDSTLGKFRVSEAGNAYVDLVSGASTTFNFGGNTFGALATLGTNDNFNLAFEINNSVRMTVETTGDVGIGTTNPIYRLDVNGAIRSSSGGFVFPDGSTQLTAVGAGGGYWAANGTAIYNLNAGNVGIGISNPFAKLDVRTTTNSNAWIMGGTAGGNYSQLVLGEGAASPTTGTYGELLRYSNASLTNAGTLIMTNYNRDMLFTTNTSLRSDLSINSSGQVRVGTRAQNLPLMVVSPDNALNTIVGAYANNLTQGVGLAYNQVRAIGSNTDVSLFLNPQGAANVTIFKNNLDFYSSADNIDAAPFLRVFDDYFNNYTPVLRLAESNSGSTMGTSYFQMTSTTGDPILDAVSSANTDARLVLRPQASGNVTLFRNNLDFYSGADNVDAIPLLRVFDDYFNQYAPVVQLVESNSGAQLADNYFQFVSSHNSDPILNMVGADIDVNFNLNPKGAGNVRIWKNNLDLYSGANNADAAPLLNVFDDFGDAYRPVVQLYPSDGGDVRIHRNDLEFYQAGDVNTISNIRIYDEWSNAFRQLLQFSIDDNAQNYLGINAGTATQTISVLGASANSGIRFNTMGTGNMYINAGPGASSGTGQGSLHIGLNSTAADTTNGITFGVGRTSSGSTAQAGIYVTDSTSGTTMRFATTNNYTTGPQTRLTIDQTGNANFTGNLAANALNLGSSAQTNGKLQMHGTNTNLSGPHIVVTTSADAFPIYQQLNWAHDNVAFNFDAYYDNSWRSSLASSNYQIYKQANNFNINYATGVAPGSIVTFQTGFTMNTSGYIGLSDTTPSSRLTLGNNVSTGVPDAFNEFQLLLFESGTAASSYGMGVESSTMWFNSNADYKWYSAASLTNGMYLNNGNLGIGTTGAPSSKLHVVGSQLRWDPTTTTTNSGILFQGGGDSYAEIRAGQVGNYNVFEPLVLNSSPTGYVGVGTITPRATLDVGGNVSTLTPLARMGPGIAFSSTTDGQAWMGSNGWMWNGSAWTRTAASAATMWGTGNNAGAFEVWTSDTASAANTAPSNSNSRLIVLNNGNVGIGLTNPSNRFEVTGNSAVNGNMLINSSGVINQTVNSWGDKWYMAGADIKVGMNQTNTAWQFDIGGVTGLTRYRFNATNAGSVNGPIVDFNTNGTSTFYGATTMNSNLIALGNAGFGTSSPSTTLSVHNANSSVTQSNFTQAITNGGIQVSPVYADGAFTPGVFWTTSNNESTRPKAGIYTRNTATGSFMYLGTSSSYVTGINNDAIVINPSGNVGLSTANPSTFRLEVNGSIVPSADNVNALGSSGRRFTEVFAANGTINTSDQRLKTDIQELQYGLDEILALNTVSFTWKGGDQTDRKLGLIAQDLQQIMPEVVHVGSDVNKTLGVYYTDLIPVTIKAIQEQQEQINAMKLQSDDQSLIDRIMALMQSDASQSKEINELNKRVASISAELVQANTTITQAPPVATMSVDLSKLETRTTSLETEIASLSARLTAMVLGASTASTSALVENQTSVSDLIVSNTANINDLGITGTITAGLLSISGMDELGGSSINTLVEPLKLQSLRGGAIEMMGGDFRIGTDGTVTIAGTVEAQTVKAETVQTKALEVDRSETENATAGTATIKAGETSVMIETTAVKADSLIFVTEKTEQFATMIVTEQKDGESFTVKIKEATSGDVTFNWLIVK